MGRRLAEPSLDAITRQLYGSLADQVSLAPCLQALGSHFDSHITALHSEDLYGRSSGLEITGEVGGAEFCKMAADYGGRWQGQNLWVVRGMEALMEEGVLVGDEVVSSADLLASDYFRYFLKPYDVRHGMGLTVRASESASMAVISINRTARSGPFAANEVHLLRALRPHLMNIYAVCGKFSALQAGASTLRASFDRSPLGVVQLDADGRVTQLNDRASQVLAAGAGVALGAGETLRFSSAQAQVHFRCALARLCNPHGDCSPESMLVRVEHGGRRAGLVLHLCVFQPNPADSRNGAQVMGFLCDLDAPPDVAVAQRVLRETLSFTPAEASVVLSLRTRHDPTQVALDLCMDVSAVRSHLQGAFRKSGTTRQSELLRLTDQVVSAAPSA